MARKLGKNPGVTQRKDRKGWWVRIHVNGHQRWFKCDTKSQAKAFYGRLKADAREEKFFPEKFIQAKIMTLRAWIDRYLAGSTNRSIKIERHYGRFWKLLLGRRLLSQITTDDCRRIQSKMNARRDKVKVRGTQSKQRGRLAPATINRRFSFLRHVLALAVKDGHLTQNPMSVIKPFPEPKRTRYFTEDELTRIQTQMRPDHWHLVVFAIETGLRRANQFSLKWDQVQMESSTVVIPLPKGGKTSHIPLSKVAKDILRSLDSFLISPYVFPSPENPLKPRSPVCFVAKVFKPALRKAGILEGRWHDLRHTAASRRVMAGVDLYAVKEILGHQNIATTMRYAHLSPGFLQEAVNRGSLVETVTKTVTSKKEGEKQDRVGMTECVESINEL